MNKAYFTIDQAAEHNLEYLIRYLDVIPPSSGALAVVQDFLEGARYESFEQILAAMDRWISYESEDAVA